jgi:tetratricopeptide (TPR) repeat protein
MGKRPFQADSPTAEASAHVNAPVPSVCDTSNLPCELDPVFRKALAKDPHARYGSCAEFVAALRAALADAAGATRPFTPVPPAAPIAYPPRRQSRAWPLLALLLVAGVAAGVLGAYFLTRDNDKHKSAAPPQPKVTTVLRTVTEPSGKTTTVLQQTTTTPPLTSSPPAGGGGHALNDSGYQRMQNGDYAGAVPLLQDAVRKLSGTGPGDPYEAFANYNLGYSLLKLGRCAEAIPFLQKADQLEPWRHEPRDALKQAKRCS